MSSKDSGSRGLAVVVCAGAALLALSMMSSGCGGGKTPQAEGPGMSVQELAAMPKIDAHAHFMSVLDEELPTLFECLDGYKMKWLTICTVGFTDSVKVDAKIALAARLHQQYPDRVAWATTFPLYNWNSPDWKERAIATIQDGKAKGAVAVKVWKEIGMVLKDPDSSFVMINDPCFDPIFDYIEQQNLTLVAHIGEPRNCWLPLDSMTVNNDRKYFAEFPQYHAFLHPEIPHYWKHVAARDSVLAHHPNLRLVGCHLGSVEFDVDEMARRFDLYPNFAVDMAARVCHLQVQDREKVRAFLIKYQDRVLYGTDLGAGREYMKTSIDSTVTRIKETYDKDFRYFATDEEMEVWEVDGKFRGLALPADVLRKIFHDNALKWYPGI
jgi:predicted TIM-barrel fold metal-dependent hydrolase